MEEHIQMLGYNNYSDRVWKNVYYMLCYSVKYLAELNLTDSDFENTSGTVDLFSKLLVKSHEYSLRFSRLSEYEDFKQVGYLPTGRIDPYRSIVTGEYAKGKLCYTERNMGINTIYNRIIKCAYELLINTDRDSSQLSNDTRKVLYAMYSDIAAIGDLTKLELIEIASGKFSYEHLPIWHKPVLAASITVINNFIYTDEDGPRLILGFDNYRKLNHIFEEFLRNYLSEMFSVNNYGVITKPVYRVDGGGTLRLDILARHNNKYLVIDAKWYNKSESGSDNENQVYRYVGETLAKHPEFDSNSAISGMLMFAKVKSDRLKLRDTNPLMHNLIVPIYSVSIDLDEDFETIKESIYNVVVSKIENMRPNNRKDMGI